MSGSFAEFRYGWHVVVASAIGIGLGMSPLPFYTIGVFIAPLSEEFGWSVAQILAGLPIFTFGALFASPMIGYITDRVGVRRVVLTSIVTFSFSMMAFSLNNGSTTLYLSLWCLLAIFGAGTLPITWTRAVTSWFNERRGLALGLSLIGTGFFGALAKLYAAYLIENYGWRGAYVGIGLLPLLIAFPVAWLFFYDTDHPKARERLQGLKTHISASKTIINNGGLSISQALRDWRFWLLAYCFIPISFAIGGPIPNLERMMASKGFSTGDAVWLASIVGISVVVGRLVGGYLLDRFWAPAVAAIILSLPALSGYMLIQPDLSFIQAAVAIFVLGLAAGVEYDLMAYLVSRYFGLKSYATIYGALYGFFALGAGFGPWLFGKSFETHQSYDVILKISIVAFLIGAIPLLLLGKYREFHDDSPDGAPGTPNS